MKHFKLLAKVTVVSTLVLSVFVNAGDKKTEKFGKEIASSPVVKFDDVLKTPEKFTRETVVTEATVHKVCQKSGCWMEVTGEKAKTRVTFKDYGFTVPANILNKKIKIAGVLKEETLSVKTQKHYLEDEGASKEEIAKIKEPKIVYHFVAEGVQIL